MKIAMICFSLTGYAAGLKLKNSFEKQGEDVSLEGKSRYLEDSFPGSAREWAELHFQSSDALIFIGACGIAVRSIAHLIAGKTKDPAVLVVDECGKFAISLLSGHLGGANSLALRAAEILGAEPVVTTATDLHSRFAVDVFSRENGCAIFRMKAAKEVSAAVLAGEKVGFYSEFPISAPLPEGLTYYASLDCSSEDRPRVGVALTIHKGCLPFPETVQVVPPAVALGVGCKKGKDPEIVKREVAERLAEQDIFPEAVCSIASIDLKKEEPALLGLAREYGVEFLTYTAQELLSCPGEFTPSAFVKNITGVDNVCERSAVLSSGGKLLFPKKGAEGVTTAAALKSFIPVFGHYRDDEKKTVLTAVGLSE